MINVSKWLATCLGIGYIQKGAGTIAALFCCIVWYESNVGALPVAIQLVILLVIFFAGVWCSTIVETEWGRDSNKVVIDEVLGMGIGLIFVKVTLAHLLLSFALFRFFDIAKPLLIRRMEKLSSGWGVMMDDVLAGIYTNLIMQLVMQFHLLNKL